MENISIPGATGILWTIDPPISTPIGPYVSGSSNDVTFDEYGIWNITVQVLSPSSHSCLNIIDTFSIEVHQSPLSINTIPIPSPCEGQTIDLRNHVLFCQHRHNLIVAECFELDCHDILLLFLQQWMLHQQEFLQ